MMTFWVLAVLISQGICVLNAVRSPIHLVPFLNVLAVSSIYYGLAAPAYWYFDQGGAFLGVDWSDQIWESAAILSISTAAISTAARILVRVRPTLTKSALREDVPFQVLLVLGLGAIGAAYCLAKPKAASDPFFLIAYQFSDLLIPACLYLVAALPGRVQRVTVVIVFTIVVSAIGFRYKLALFWGALLGWLFLRSVQSSRSRGRALVYAKFSIALIGLVAVLAVSTLVRRPFGGVDLSDVHYFDSSDFLYGLFAEGNTIFGLSAILDRIVPSGRFIYFAPFRDAALELIPRFLYPDRTTGEYLKIVLGNLVSKDAYESGTAYLYLGEYLLMGGWLGLVIGCIAFVSAVGLCARYIARRTVKSDVRTMGYALVGVFFGYYYFSRGYLPQTLKAFLFVLVPFMVMLLRFRIRS